MRQLLLVALLAASPLLAQIADGDRHYALRAEGAQGVHAPPQRVDAAIAAFQRAIAQDANDLEAHWKLLRAYRYKGACVVTSREEKKKVYGEAKRAGEKALAVVNRLLASKGVKANAPEEQVAKTARTLPGAAETFLWDAINWGEWALAHGKLAAARQGAADRIRREATIALYANPTLEGGSPARVLGRLHDQTPRIPFITGWASKSEALRFLEESRKHDPTNKLTLLFLAEAMVSNNSSTKPKAIELLRTVVNSPPNPQFAIESAQAIEDAKALLRKWDGSMD